MSHKSKTISLAWISKITDNNLHHWWLMKRVKPALTVNIISIVRTGSNFANH